LAWAVLDSGIYIGHWELGLHDDLLARVRRGFVIRHSAVVLSELRRGAKTRQAVKRVEDLHRKASIRWSPTEREWWEAGKLVREIGDSRGWETRKRRDFQNDALIALTARRHGAAIVTANREDFEILGRCLGVRIVLPG
jgi:predicted nucleic acid-binding protein